ncbi:MAG: hypothetical protein P4L53_23285 [Candidatus Obscuribacterales bacterium]|nr:hypothetical protein [Candidatus Obscuribacterales bacterium]
MIDISKRRLLADQVNRLHQLGQLAIPLGCDYNSGHAERWTDRITGKEYLRLFPQLLQDSDLGFAPQTVVLLDSIVCNLGVTDGAQFAIDFTADTNGSNRIWYRDGLSSQSKTNRILAWICIDEQFGAMHHEIFGKEAVQQIADAFATDKPLHGKWRSLRHGIRRIVWYLRNHDRGRPLFDAKANWSVSDTRLRELLPQLGSLDGKLFGLAEALCLNEEHAEHWAQHRFTHPVYWTRNLAREGDKIRRSVLPNVLHYASESLATRAVFLGLYAASIQGSSDTRVQQREGYILAEALNCLARAHALRACADLQKEEPSSPEIAFDVIGSDHFERAYIEVYKAIGGRFSQVLSGQY